jgi:short-subunit dehydrogenase
MCVKYIVKKSISCKKKWTLVCIPRFVNKFVLTIYNILPRTRSHKLFKRLFD